MFPHTRTNSHFSRPCMSSSRLGVLSPPLHSPPNIRLYSVVHVSLRPREQMQSLTGFYGDQKRTGEVAISRVSSESFARIARSDAPEPCYLSSDQGLIFLLEIRSLFLTSWRCTVNEASVVEAARWQCGCGRVT